jgi:hypothetical protein
MAVFPVAPGGPDYSSTGPNKYISQIYSALLIKKFYPGTMFSEISNTLYEGEIKNGGDTVIIRTRPTIETFSYKKGMVLPVQNPESPFQSLVIDQGEGFSFALDRVDEFQSDLKLMNIWAEDAAEQMKQVIDRKVFTKLATNGFNTTTLNGRSALIAGSYTSLFGTSYTLGTSGSPINLTGTTAAEKGDALLARILQYGQILDENNIPETDRFVVLPASAIQYLKQSKLAFAYLTGDNVSPLRNGKVGGIDRFKLFMSNNLYKSTASNNPVGIIFGHKYATTFATQITESRTIENPFSFGKLMQGLQVYGFDLIKSDTVGVDFIY